MPTSQLKNTELEFTNSESNQGSLSFTTSEEFEVNRPLQCSQGIVSSNLTVSGSGSYSVHTNFDDITAGDLRMKDDSGDVITLKAPSSVTAHTLTLPSAQGTSGTYLKNDGSGGLTWSGAASTTDIFPIKFSYTEVASGWNNLNCTHDSTNLGNTSSSAFTPSFSSGTTLSQVVVAAGTYRFTVQFQWKMDKNTTVTSLNNGVTFMLTWDGATSPTEYMKFIEHEIPHTQNGYVTRGYSHQTRIVKFASSKTLIPQVYRGSSLSGLTAFYIDQNVAHMGYNMIIEKLS